MIRVLKILTTTCLTLSLLVTPVFASNAAQNDVQPEIDQVKITITNNETGETKIINPSEATINQMQSLASISESEDGTKTAGYDLYIPIEDIITPDSVGNGQIADGGAYTGGVQASLHVNFDVNSTNEQVRVNKVYGSWTPDSNMYYLSDRVVGCHDGVAAGIHKLEKYPTTNTFSYTTGWGWHYRIWGDASPRAWSDAVIHVTGMTGTHTISVEFTFS